MLDPNLVAYYTRQAGEYEKIFHRDDPVRQEEQLRLTAAMRSALNQRQVLELACGTAYWTERVVESVASITSLDSSAGMLACARRKTFWSDKARLIPGDAYALQSVPGTFNAALANFWISHVPRNRLHAFLQQLHQRLADRAVVFFADNMLLPGVGGGLFTPAGSVDTYKRRPVADGTTCDVLKNYYSKEELRALLAPYARDLEITVEVCFWWATYRVA